MSTKKAVKKNTVANNKAAVKSVKAQDERTEAYSYVIEKNVPVEGVRTRSLINTFPFPQMSIGDSFLIPPEDRYAENPNTIHYAAQQYAKIKAGFTVTTRLQLNKYRRVWRLK
jgi:hypothetical protein